MSSLKPKHIDSDDQEEQAVEYIEITEKDKIKALRKAEKQRNNPVPNPPVLQQAVKEEAKKPAPQKESKNVIELKEVKEEKEKIVPTKKDNPNRNETRNDERELHKDQEKKSKYQQKSTKVERKEEVQQKPKYIEKPKKEAEEEKIYYQNQRKQSAEVVQQQPKKITREVPKNRNQNDNIKGENVEVKIEDIEDEYDNQIYINKKSVQDYLDRARELIKKYDFIALKAFGNKIHKAILIAGLISQEFAQLKQINIPRTVNVSQTTKQGSFSKKRAAITIELSLKKLNKRHIGYQESDAEPREQYHNEKSQSRYVQKSNAEYSEKPKYIEKPTKYNDRSNDYSQKTSSKARPSSNYGGNNNRFREKGEDERDFR